MYTNIQSLRYKVHHVAWEIAQSENVFAFCLTETFLGSEINLGELKVNGYQLFRRDRDSRGGGVAIYVRTDVQATKIALTSPAEALLLKCKTNECNFFMLVVYRPPSNRDSDLIPNLLDEVLSVMNNKLDPLFICGDFNLPQIDWADYCSNGNYALCNPFLNKVAELGLHQHIHQPTHNKGNILDLVLTNTHLISGVGIFDPLYSDHSIISTDIDINSSQNQIDNTTTEVRLYHKVDMEKAMTIFPMWSDQVSTMINRNQNIDEVYGVFVSGINEIVNKCIPTKIYKIQQSDPKWMNKNLKRNLRKQKQLYKRMKQENTFYGRKKFMEIRKTNKKLVQQAKRSYLNKKLYKPLLSGDSKPFFRFLKESRENESDVMPDLTYQDQTANTSADKATLLNSFFETVFVTDDNETPLMSSPQVLPNEDELVISEHGVLVLLEDLDEKKSGGPDLLSCKILKLFAVLIAPCLTKIFQYSISSLAIPSIWKVAKIKPIFKKGSKHMPTNYRPISLTCVTSKILEHIVSTTIHTHLDSNNILTDSQHGFRNGRSCDTQLVYTLNELTSNLDQGLVTDVIILDFSKAFDSVNHRKLLHKLKHLGINENLVFWIQEFLTNRYQYVSVDSFDSPLCMVTSGVPQGSVLGPLLFLLYVNDLPGMLSSDCRLFADDSLLFNSRANKAILQQDLEILEKFAADWQLRFNVAKCAVITIGECNSVIDYFLCDSRLTNVNTHPYLGIELQHNLKWDHHYDKIISKANRSLGMLRRVLKDADTKTRQVAFLSLVRPVLEFGCLVWDPYLKRDIKRMEKVQNSALRFIYRIRGQISFTELRNSICLDSLGKRRQNLRQKFYMKAIEKGFIVPDYKNIEKLHDTRQRSDLYVPSIRTSIYFNSFWPRTTRELRIL